MTGSLPPSRWEDSVDKGKSKEKGGKTRFSNWKSGLISGAGKLKIRQRFRGAPRSAVRPAGP